METEKWHRSTAGLQNQPEDAGGGTSAKQVAVTDTETSHLKTRLAEDEYEISKLKEKITEINFENRSLTIKNAALESENERLKTRLTELNSPKEYFREQAEQAPQIIKVNPIAVHAQHEIIYLNSRISKLKNLKGWMSLVIVLLISTLVLIYLNRIYKI